MGSNNRYDEEDLFPLCDNDPQDGTYFRELEKSHCHAPAPDKRNGSIDFEHELRKEHCALYIRIHEELLENADYLNAYNKLLDECAREYAYDVLGKTLSTVTDKDRELEISALDFLITCTGKNEVEKYKDDAIYIVEWIKSGKSLTVYT